MMAFSPKFDPLPTLEEEEELITLTDILRLRDRYLNDDELWSVCHETCLALLSLEKTSPELFSNLCLNTETLLFNSSGGVNFLDKDAASDSFLPPEYKEGAATIQGHIFSLGKTLLEALVTADENGNGHFGKDHPSEFFNQMCSKDPDDRPMVLEVIRRCKGHLQKHTSPSSSKVVCSKLTAWSRRKLSLELTQLIDFTHLKELSSINGDQSDSSTTTTSSSTSDNRKKRLSSRRAADLGKRKRSLPKLPDDNLSKSHRHLNGKNKTEGIDANMDRSTLSPPNLDAFGNLSERAQEILRKIYDTSEQEAKKRDDSEGEFETETGQERNKESSPSRKNNILIEKPHLLKRNSIASVGTSFSSQWLHRSVHETNNYRRTDKSNSEGNIKESIKGLGADLSGGSDDSSLVPDRKYGISHHGEDVDAISNLANILKSRTTGYGCQERVSNPSISSSPGNFDLMEQTDREGPVENILQLDEDFILDDPWSEESDVDAARIIKPKLRSHSIAAFNALDPRSSAFKTPRQSRSSQCNKSAQSSTERLSVESNSESQEGDPSSEPGSEISNSKGHETNRSLQLNGAVDKSRRHSHSFEGAKAVNSSQMSKRRNTVSDIGDVPSNYTSSATHFTPIIVAGENFVSNPSSKSISSNADTKLKAKMAFEAIKKSSKKERPPKTMVSDIEKDAMSDLDVPTVGNNEDWNPSESTKIDDPKGSDNPKGSDKFTTSSKADESNKCTIKETGEDRNVQEGEVTGLKTQMEKSSPISHEIPNEKVSPKNASSSSVSEVESSGKQDGRLSARNENRDRLVSDLTLKGVRKVSSPNVATLTDISKLQTAKVTVVAGSPLPDSSLFSPIDKPKGTDYQPEKQVPLNPCPVVPSISGTVDKPDRLDLLSAITNERDHLSPTTEPVVSSDIIDQQSINVTKSNSLNIASAAGSPAITRSSPSLHGVTQQQEQTVLGSNSNAAMTSPHDAVGSMPFTVGAPVSPSQQSPGVFSMQVQFQQDPQTGLFRMIPIGTPAFSPSPALSGSPLLYSPSHPMSSPQQHSSPFYPINSSLSSPQRQVDTSSDPENGDVYRNVAIPDTRRDPHRRTAAPSNKKSANSKRLERRLLSDSESSESSVFTPKPSGINSDKFPSKPGRLKTRSQSSTNLEKNKKHSKRSSADPVLGHREGGRLIDKSSNHSSRSSKSTERGKLKASSASKSSDVRGLKQAAAPASSPMTVSSPSRDSGVHMRYSMSSGEELPVTKEVSEPSLVLKRVIRHIRHAFAFDGYLENGVEALQMAEYITALAHLSWSTFSSAVTEKYCDLYWEEELLESLYEEINCKKVDKPNLKLSNDLSDSPKRETKHSLKKSHVKSKKSLAASVTEKTSAEIRTSNDKENALDSEKSHTARSDQSSSSTERKPNTNSQQKKTPNGVTKSHKHDETDTLSHSSPRRTSSSSPKKSSKDGENKQSHASPNCIKDDKKSSSSKSKSSSKQRRSDNHVQEDKIIEPEQQKEELRNDPQKDEKNSSVSSKSNNSGDSHHLERTDSASDNKTRQVIDTSPRKSNHSEITSLKSEDGDTCNKTPNNSLDERGSLIGVQKCSTLVNEGASPLLSARMSQRSSSSLFGSLQSLNNSLSLSESSYLQSPQKADSDISEVSSTPTAFHIRQLLDSAITRSSSNASLTSFSSGSSSNQGPSSSCRSLGSQGHGGNQKLQQALMYGEDSFQRDVIEYSRRLEGKNVERKITEVEQQISVERKMRGKTERFYQKLLESQNNNNNKGAETKNKLSKVREQLEEMNSKMTFLDSVRCYLELAFAEQWGLDHSLLHSFAISQKPMHLQPHSDNPMLQMKTSRGGTSLLQAGDPQGLFAYLFAKRAVMEGYLYHFLYIFRYLSKRQKLFTFIMDKFQAAECLPNGLEDCRTQITRRTIDIFHVWLEGFFEVDFRQDPELLAEVISFISNKLVDVNQQGQGLLQLIDRKEKQEDVVSVKTADKSEEDWPGNLPRQNLASTSPWLSRKETKDKLSVGGIIACFSKRSSKNQDSAYLPVMALNKDGFSLSEHTSNGLAEQLTLIQQSIFLQVHPVYYLNSRHKGIGVQTMTEASNKSVNLENIDSTSLFSESITDGGISELLDYSRNLSHWVSAEVLSCSSPKAQLALISKFINTAKSCYDMRNFATCMQVMDGLNNLIVRQVPAWKNIPSKVVSIYEELEAAGVLLKGDCDFLIRGDHHKTLPTLPCVHLVLMHIQQLEIGGFKLANGMYKWPKLKSIAECVDQVRVFQEHRYTLNSDEVLQGLLKTRIQEFRNSDIHILAASNHANFHQFSSEKGSKKLQSALQRVKANLH
ncbi:uncharacterized protein [Apostichopus japonicus]|uniref:uncharacterized protein isoform X2 n=1 Tax=Stichopus japonicus TaxID=307972 RepID=UPI003AB805F8